jgi:hypothetical protein
MAVTGIVGIETKNGKIESVRGSKRSTSTIDVNHRANHDGYLYRVPYFKTVAASSYAVLWLVSSSTVLESHLYLNYSADNSGYLDIWNGAVSATSQWASITPVNANGWSTNAAQVVAFSGGVPSTSTATLLYIESVGSGGKTSGGGTGGLINEIIMTPSSTYAIRFTATSTEADVSFSINFYEEEVED